MEQCGSKQSVSFLEVLQIFFSFLLALLYLAIVLQSGFFHLAIFALQFEQNLSPFLFLQGNLSQDFLLFCFVPFQLAQSPLFLFCLVLPNSVLYLLPLLLLHLLLFLFLVLVFLHLTFPVIEYLVQQVHPCFLTLLPLFLLFLLFLQSFDFNQPIQLLLVAHQLLVLILETLQCLLRFFPFFFLQLLFILRQLPLLMHYPFNHFPIRCLLCLNLLLFHHSDTLVLLQHSSTDLLLLLDSLSVLHLCQLALAFPLQL